MFSGLEIIILVLLKKRKSLCLETLDPNGSHISRKKYEPPYHVKVLMLSLVQSPFLFSLVWPTVRWKRSSKTHLHKTLAKLAIFLKKTTFHCICLDGWERGIQTICFFIIRVDWVPVTECTYTLFEVMPGNNYWKEINHNNMQFSYRSPTETIPILN